MCFHLTSTLPKGTNVEALRDVIDKHHMAFTPISNPHISPQLHPGELYFITSKGHCDCGTVLGYKHDTEDLEELLQSKKARKLRKRGWNAEQIDQWARNKLANKPRTHGRTFSPIEISHETTKWIDFLHELLQSANLSHVGLLKHWYSGRLDTEQFQIKRTEQIHLKDVNTTVLTHLEEDVLYEFLLN